jgi:RecB family endonuclease NucS
MIERIYAFLREKPGEWFDDGEIQKELGIKNRAQVNSRCRQLADKGRIVRSRIGGRLKNSYEEREEVIPIEPTQTEPLTKPNEISISLERDLETFIFENIDSVEGGLKPYRGESGRQYTVESGRIDILATDKDDNFVVIELKADTGGDAVLTQTLAYMVDIEKIAEQRKVRGIIIARDFSSKLVSAVSRVQDIKLMKYKVKFDFEKLT